MANGIRTVFGKLADPAYLCVGFVVGLGAIVVPVPYGIIVGGIAGLAMLFGLVLLERMDERDSSRLADD
jgi:hypothetical protein